MRKTVSLQSVLDIANQMLANSEGEQVLLRVGVADMISSILMDAKNYGGYQYLSPNEVSEGKPGVRPGNVRYAKIDGEEVDLWFLDTDDTRREYFLKKS